MVLWYMDNIIYRCGIWRICCQSRHCRDMKSQFIPWPSGTTLCSPDLKTWRLRYHECLPCRGSKLILYCLGFQTLQAIADVIIELLFSLQLFLNPSLFSLLSLSLSLCLSYIFNNIFLTFKKILPGRVNDNLKIPHCISEIYISLADWSWSNMLTWKYRCYHHCTRYSTNTARNWPHLQISNHTQ